ncbi:MAG: hypothetical protein R2825_23840 [Saprospiraceae bacterium]
MQTIQQPLTNAQLEILKVFSHQLSEKDLIELRKILAIFFAKKAVEAAIIKFGMRKAGLIKMSIGC